MGEAGARRTRVWAMVIEDLFADLAEGRLGWLDLPGPRGMSQADVAAALGGESVRVPPPQLFEALPLPREFEQTFLVDVPFETLTGTGWVGQVRITLMSAASYEDWRAVLLRVRRESGQEFTELRGLVRERLAASARRRAQAVAEAPPLPPAVRVAAADHRAGVEAAARRLSGGDQALTAALMPRLQPSIRMRPCPPERTASRLGGVAFLPENADWPRRATGSPLALVAQLDLAEVPRLPLAEGLPCDGRLLLFYDVIRQPWGEWPQDADGFAVRYVPAGVPAVATAPPADAHDELLLPSSGVSFEPDATIDLFDLDLADAQRDVVWTRHEADEPHHRLLGVPEAVQDDPRAGGPAQLGEGWTLLAQLDSGAPLDIDFGDGGRIYFLVPAGDLRAGRFDPGWVVLQCH